MDWLAPLLVLAANVIFWRLPTRLARYRWLLIGSIVLPAFMTAQWLTGLDQRPLDRIIVALAFTIANLLLVALTVWIARRAQGGQRGAGGVHRAARRALFRFMERPAPERVLKHILAL